MLEKVFVLSVLVFMKELHAEVESINTIYTLSSEHRYRRQANQQSDGSCILPNFPQNGYYSVGGSTASPVPGDSLPEWSALIYQCDSGYILNGQSIVNCNKEQWLPKVPQCLRACKPLVSASVQYTCIRNNAETSCKKRMVHGTKADIKCKWGYKYIALKSDTIICRRDGSWSDERIICVPECGTLPAQATPHVIGGSPAAISEFPWHAGIYDKTKSSGPIQICGGSLVTANIVLSAAHCFTSDDQTKFKTAESFAVGIGKVHRGWMDERDNFAKHSNVKSLVLHPEYDGIESLYIHDIAIVYLEQLIKFTSIIRPVCIEWQSDITTRDIEDNQLGKVAGWGLTTEGGDASPTLVQLSIPTIPRQQCRNELSDDFRPFVTFDKFCAGYLNGSSVCRGDSGGGLCFPKQENQEQVYYLRGIVSVGPTKEGSCDSQKYTAFTNVVFHRDWLKEQSVHIEPPVFECDSGEYINIEAKCNGISDCPDNSDEGDDLCEKPIVVKERPTVPSFAPPPPDLLGEGCILPEFPENGTYKVPGLPNSPTPGEAFAEWGVLNFNCDNSFTLSGDDTIFCAEGKWSSDIPKCLPVITDVIYDDCTSVPGNVSNIFNVKPPKSTASFPVFCELDDRNEIGPFTVIQRRKTDDVNFYRNYSDYQNGFGNLNESFWLGLEKIYQITRSGKYLLFIYMVDFDDNVGVAAYSQFELGSEDDGYRLNVEGYQGDAGDSFLFHNGLQFSTYDHDVDSSPKNCAEEYQGGWWYASCTTSNLNGPFNKRRVLRKKGIGITWYLWLSADIGLKNVTMAIQRRDQAG